MINFVLVTKDYGSHKSEDTYISQEEMFCPSCGKKSVWREAGYGDLYEGPDYVCISCGASGTLLPWKKAEGVFIQVINQINKALEVT